MSNSHSWALRHQKLVTTIALIVVAFVIFGGSYIYLKNKITSYSIAIVKTRLLLLKSLESRNKALQKFNNKLPIFNYNFSNDEIKNWYNLTDKTVNNEVVNILDPTKEQINSLVLLRRSEEDVKIALFDYNLAIKYLNHKVVTFPSNLISRKMGIKLKNEINIKNAFATNF